MKLKEYAGKHMEKLKFLYIAGGNMKWCNCCGNQSGSSSNNEIIIMFHSGYKPKRTGKEKWKWSCSVMSDYLQSHGL